MQTTTALQYEIEFHSIRVEDNRLRRYRIILAVRPMSAEPYRTTIQWGRPGQNPRVRERSFPTLAEAAEYVKRVIRRRRQHGYELTWMSKGHPLKDWIEAEEMTRKGPLETASSQGRLF